LEDEWRCDVEGVEGLEERSSALVAETVDKFQG
jgi:hypothetical protein